VAVVASHDVPGPRIAVPDVLAATGLLARAVIDRLGGLRVVAITGSAGKTGTKDLLGDLLGPSVATIAPVGSFNNELGLPLTALRADEQTRFLVLEMGARGRGHIAYLTEIAPPSIGVVLMVGTAHLGEFGGQEAIAEAKRELVEALPADGQAVLNADDPRVAAMAEHTAARVVAYSTQGRPAEVRAEGLRLESGRPSFTLVAPQGSAEVSLALVGEHQASNALAAAAVALEVGIPMADVARRLSEARPRSPMRMALHEGADGVVVIDDSYNASPEAVRAALKTLVEVAAGRRTWAVLGEMRELGERSLEEHDAIGRLAVRLDVGRLVSVGEGARALHLGASHEGSWGQESAYVADADEAIALLRAEVRPGDVVLVKASRAIGLDRVAEALISDHPAADTTGGGR
jgi:UDP-N-acetylmuramoyl-tripeptide--D-alanyl-D-alanine ligase